MSDTFTPPLSRVTPVVGALTCDCWGRVRNLTAPEVVHFVETQWPPCCGLTMRLPSDRTVDNGD